MLNKCSFEILGDMDAKTFMKEYWQKKPCVYRGSVGHLLDSLPTDNDLAGLTLEENVESRLVIGRPGYDNNTVHVTTGPFHESELTELGNENWTLLVQSVDYWDDSIAQLMRQVSFIPNWRVDDIMVSLAAPGGGVGPHRDQYDVFLIQAKGVKNWRISQPSNDVELIIDNQLKLLPPFKASLDLELNEGDVLYLPPGWSHWGIAKDFNITYSIGFRTPDTISLVDSIAELMQQNEDFQGNKNIQDPWREPQQTQQISDVDIHEFEHLLENVIKNKSLLFHAFAHQVSLPKVEAAFSDPLSENEIANILQHKEKWQFKLNPMARMTYFYHDSQLTIYLNGECFYVDNMNSSSSKFNDILDTLCQHQWLSGDMISSEKVDHVIAFILNENLMGLQPQTISSQ